MSQGAGSPGFLCLGGGVGLRVGSQCRKVLKNKKKRNGVSEKDMLSIWGVRWWGWGLEAARGKKEKSKRRGKDAKAFTNAFFPARSTQLLDCSKCEISGSFL